MATINTLDSWLADTIGNPARRAAVRALEIRAPHAINGGEYWAPRFVVNSGGCIVCPFALARKYLFLRDEHLVSIDGVLGVLKRARDDASLFASLVCTDADRIRTTGGSPLLETVEPERYVMA